MRHTLPKFVPTLVFATIVACKPSNQNDDAGVMALPVDNAPTVVNGISVDFSEMRSRKSPAVVQSWLDATRRYSKLHYHEDTYKLDPRCIVLHYTVSTSFARNLVDSTSLAGEEPGVSSHYQVGEKKVWQIVPLNVRSRGTYGINHRSISIEMIAMDQEDLSRRKETIENAAHLVYELMRVFPNISLKDVFSHYDVSKMDKKIVPYVLDYVDSSPYGKPDPGQGNLKTIKKRAAELLRVAYDPSEEISDEEALALTQDTLNHADESHSER